MPLTTAYEHYKLVITIVTKSVDLKVRLLMARCTSLSKLNVNLATSELINICAHTATTASFKKN